MNADAIGRRTGHQFAVVHVQAVDRLRSAPRHANTIKTENFQSVAASVQATNNQDFNELQGTQL